VPAAAVIPAPIAYTKVVAVKKLVVGFLCAGCWSASMRRLLHRRTSCWQTRAGHLVVGVGRPLVYFEKIKVFKAGNRLNTLAWNNSIGL
jgi:hypothetical protein